LENIDKNGTINMIKTINCTAGNRMKKVLLVVSILLLSGCSKVQNDADVNDFEIDVIVCKEDCSSIQSDFNAINQIHKANIESYNLSIAPNMNGDSKLLFGGETYEREDLNRTDPISGNWYIPISGAIAEYSNMMFQMSFLVQNCEVNTDCSSLSTNVEYLTKVDYGFNEHSGYYTFTAIEDDDNILFIEELKFNFDDEFGNYEYIRYYPGKDLFEYKTWIDGVLSIYKLNDDMYTFDYINVNTMEVTSANIDDEMYTIMHFNPLESIYYLYNSKSNKYSVSLIDNFEPVAELSYDGVYKCGLNFHFVNGWDSLFKTDDPSEFSFDTLYNNDEIVFDQFQIRSQYMGLRYHNIFGYKEVPADDINSFRFPNEYTGELTFDELYSKLTKFVGYEHGFKIAGVTMIDLFDDIDEIHKYLIEKY